MARRVELRRTGSDDLTLGSILTTVTIVVTGLVPPGAWPVDPRNNSVELLVDDSKRVMEDVKSLVVSPVVNLSIQQTLIRDWGLSLFAEPRAMIHRVRCLIEEWCLAG